uniref:Uncharacterized protein n=1 Tax=Monopterus albus TaxID=43700 RepID=A0A3Q3KF12_MONAL
VCTLMHVPSLDCLNIWICPTILGPCVCVCGNHVFQFVIFFQKCAPGFYRDGSGPYVGQCVPCECNGLADMCEDSTGRCLNCKYNTAGDQCERCKEGYYGNAAKRTCSVCPCPFATPTNSFAIGCSEVFGKFQCICRAGYTGDSCERCAPGYYGDPVRPGGSCRPCNCNGNGNNCDPQTGECDNCAQTLLQDLEKLDDELVKIKAELDKVTASASSQDRLKKLEKAVADTKVSLLTNSEGYRQGEKFNIITDWSVTLAFTYPILFYPPVLDYIKANVSKQCDQNEAAAEKIRGLLNNYEAKLKDLDKALKEAVDLVKTANAQNGLNTKAMDDLQDYEQLAAQLDGAKMNLTAKVNEISKAAGHEDLVVAAEKHAKELDKLAKDLEDTVKNASGRTEVRNARDAIEAYKNITDAINAAEAAANEAKDASENALNVSHRLDFFNALCKFTHFFRVTKIKTLLYINIFVTLLHAVKDLLNAIPSLNKKISEVESLTTQFSPISNVSENIKKIKELIEQARDAANRIVIPMKFTGEGHVELRPPKNLEDLKAYTALSLSLQRPLGSGDNRRRRRQARASGDMFVLYLGSRDSSKNYIGMYLKNNVLFGVYKLNGEEYQIKAGYITRSAPESARFDRVDLHRIYQDAEMILTKDISSTTPKDPIQNSQQGNSNKNLLDLSPGDVVFYVGGYPSNFTPPALLNYPMYDGCIEFSSFNDKIVSLYNFQHAEKINLETPCKRYIMIRDSTYYEGTGYSKVVIDKASSNVLISMSILTRLENGLLLYMGTEVNVLTEILIIFQKTGKILARTTTEGEMAAAQAEFNTDEFKEFYIGGAPQDVRERYNITIQPFKGCLSNLKLNKDFKAVDEEVGVSKDCPLESLVGHSSLHPEPANGINLALDNGYVILSFNDKMWKSNKQYHDGQWHYLTINRRAGRYEGDSDFACKPSNMYSTLANNKQSTVYRQGHMLPCCHSQHTQALKMMFLFIFPRPHFSLDVKTRSPEGLLFFAATRGGQSHLALYMSKGRIRLSVGKQKEIFNREKYNDGKWHSVIFSLEKKKFRLVVDGIRAQDGQLTSTELASMQQFMSPVYLGSLKALPKQSVSGCVRNFKMNGASMSNPTTNHGAGPCFEGQTQRGAYFSGNGAHVIINDSFVVGSSFELLFNIRPRNLTGLLLHVGDASRTQYGPGMGHYLSIYMLRGEVRVDYTPVCFLITRSHSMYLSAAETSVQQMLPVTSSFVGCIQDMRINGDLISFEKLSGLFGPVNIKECPG